MNKLKILIVDDDEHIAELLALYLEKECYETFCVHHGLDVIDTFKSFKPNLILLDLMLPGMDGFELCQKIRSNSDTPIIILSAKGETIDKIVGLELGADDYIQKPFETKEVIARVKAVLRRYKSSTPTKKNTSADSVLIYNNFEVNILDFYVKIDGVELDMTPKEIELLHLLASKPNQLNTRETLLEKVWGDSYSGDSRNIDVHIKRIREKMRHCKDCSIMTVWGKGYKFEVHNA